MYKYIFLLISIFILPTTKVVGQTSCNICPANSSVTLSSDFTDVVTYAWTCTNGFTSSSAEPTFTPSADVTCNLVVTDGAGCTATSQVVVDVCECDCNEDMCIDMNYSASTECVTFSNTGTPCSPVSSESRQYRNSTGGSWVNIPANNQICDCDIRERVNTNAFVSISSSNFRLNIDGLLNRCSPCSGNNMQLQFTFGVNGYNATFFPSCAGSSDWYTISPADFTNAGSVATAHVQYTTPFGIVVNTYRFSYNGAGLNVNNVTVTEVAKRSIYKTIESRRILFFTDGCTSETCNNTLVIPQQPNSPCTHFLAFVNNVNLGSPCSGAGLSVSVLNATGSLSYSWKHNGTVISGETTQFLCMVGRPSGTYCAIVDDGTCTSEVCVISQPPCNLAVNVTSSGNTLTASLTNCTGTITRQWQRWNGSSWVNVGTNSNTYNTNGLAGEYRVNVTCSGPPSCSAIGTITFIPPCTSTVTLSNTSPTITSTVTGCSGATINYTWERWNGTSWVFISSVSTTNTTQSITPTVSGLHRVSTLCSGCSSQASITFTLPNPCAGYSANMTGTFTTMCQGDSRTFGRTTTGGTAPFTQQWTLNSTNVGTATTYNFTPATTGLYSLVITVTDANGCVFVDSRSISVVVCCGMTVALAPNTQSVCQNQDANFTASQTGGTLPVTYNWTSQLPPSGPIGQGSGATKTLNFAATGTYTIQVTGTAANGCTSQATSTLTVTNCTNCVCTPTLSLNGCVLTGTFTGAGCANFTYQLQYSASGTGWGSVASGNASSGGTFNHTPSSNGFYRCVINGTPNGCGTTTTPDISVNCVTTCGCTGRSLSYNTSTCILSWTAPCATYTSDLERFNGTNWVYITQTSPHNPTQNGDYRVVYRKGGCPDVISNTVTVNQNSCPARFAYYDPDLDFNVHTPLTEFVLSNRRTNVLPPINNLSFAYSSCGVVYNSFFIDWGDATSTTVNNSAGLINHQYTTGEYTTSFEATNSGRTSINELWVNADDCFNQDCSDVNIYPTCFDGGVPIFYEFNGCSNVDILISFGGGWKNYTTYNYTSHYVKINNVNYIQPYVDVTYTSSSGQFWIGYDFVNTPTAITIPYSAGWYEIEVGLTFNTNKTIITKGFFKLCD